MSAISPNAFASPAANDGAGQLPPLLREQVRRLERANSSQRASRNAVPLGVPTIDALLPEGGLLAGALHEIEAGPSPSGRVAPHDGAALGFTAHLLSRFGGGTILWCRRASATFDAPPYAPALARWFDPARLLLVSARRDDEVFWAMEEGLRCPGVAAVLGETRSTDMTAGRRLSLAAEKHGIPALLLRSEPAPPQSICVTRWRVASAPTRSTPGLADLGASRWCVQLRRNRFGAPAADEIPTWLVEWNDEAHCLSVVPQAGDRSTGAFGASEFGAGAFERRLVG